MNYIPNKISSPTNNNADTELTRIMYEGENGFFNMSQVLASSENQSSVLWTANSKQRSSK